MIMSMIIWGRSAMAFLCCVCVEGTGWFHINANGIEIVPLASKESHNAGVLRQRDAERKCSLYCASVRLGVQPCAMYLVCF